MRLLATLFLLWSLPAQADLATLQAQLTATPVLSGAFLQKKTLAGLPMPLHSSGRFLYWRGHGLHWALQQPVEASIRITPQALVQSENGRETLRVDAAEQPGFRIIAELFFSLFEVDIAELQEHFTLIASDTEHGWQLQLTPRDAQVAATVSDIIVRGDSLARQIRFTAANGDITDISLQALQVAEQPPAENPLAK